MSDVRISSAGEATEASSERRHADTQGDLAGDGRGFVGKTQGQDTLAYLLAHGYRAAPINLLQQHPIIAVTGSSGLACPRYATRSSSFSSV